MTPLTLWRARSGVAALEFALVAPALVLVIVATVELSYAFRVQAKLNIAAGQLAMVVATLSSATPASIADACTGAALNMLPFLPTALSATVASVSVDHPGNRGTSSDMTSVQAYLDWENAAACTAPAATALGLPGAFGLANSPQSLLTKSGAAASGVTDPGLQYGASAIVVQATYAYANVSPFLFGSSIKLSAAAIARPRSNATVGCTNGTAKCGQTP